MKRIAIAVVLLMTGFAHLRALDFQRTKDVPKQKTVKFGVVKKGQAGELTVKADTENADKITGSVVSPTTSWTGGSQNLVASIKFTIAVGSKQGKDAPGTHTPVFKGKYWKEADNDAPGGEGDLPDWELQGEMHVDYQVYIRATKDYFVIGTDAKGPKKKMKAVIKPAVQGATFKWSVVEGGDKVTLLQDDKETVRATGKAKSAKKKDVKIQVEVTIGNTKIKASKVFTVRQLKVTVNKISPTFTKVQDVRGNWVWNNAQANRFAPPHPLLQYGAMVMVIYVANDQFNDPFGNAKATEELTKTSATGPNLAFPPVITTPKGWWLDKLAIQAAQPINDVYTYRQEIRVEKALGRVNDLTFDLKNNKITVKEVK